MWIKTSLYYQQTNFQFTERFYALYSAYHWSQNAVNISLDASVCIRRLVLATKQYSHCLSQLSSTVSNLWPLNYFTLQTLLKFRVNYGQKASCPATLPPTQQTELVMETMRGVDRFLPSADRFCACLSVPSFAILSLQCLNMLSR